MKRKLFGVLLTVLLLFTLPVQIYARENLDQVLDFAGLFTEEERLELEATADALREAYEMDVVILTENGLGGKRPQDYADDYYDQNGYGCGENNSGILFLLDMEQRDWYISTCGDAIYAVTDYGIQQLGEAALPYLAEGEYYEAFAVYLIELPVYFDALEEGNPIDGYADYSGEYYHGDQEYVVYYEEEFTPSVFLSFVVGVVVAFVSILIMRISMNTKRPQRGASSYMQPGTYQLQQKQDIFLYSKVSKTRRQQNTSGGGGSSVHRSSSGRRHGGGGGKF